MQRPLHREGGEEEAPLIQHQNAEIRRTAAWALGRTNDLSLARYLVNALEDPDVDVNVEVRGGRPIAYRMRHREAGLSVTRDHATRDRMGRQLLVHAFDVVGH